MKAVQGDGGWNTPDIVTKSYAHILDENPRRIASKMETKFYGKNQKSRKNELQESQPI